MPDDSRNPRTQARAYIEACGGPERAVQAIICLGRALWKVEASSRWQDTGPVSNSTGYRLIAYPVLVDFLEGELRRSVHGPQPYDAARHAEAVLRFMREASYLEVTTDSAALGRDCFRFAPQLYHPSSVCEALLRPVLEASLIRYLLRREKRGRFGVPLSPYVVRAFNVLAAILNRRVETPRDTELSHWLTSSIGDGSRDVAAPSTRTLTRDQRVWRYPEIREELETALRRDVDSHGYFPSEAEPEDRESAIRKTVAIFVEVCLMVKAFTAPEKYVAGGALVVRTDFFDAEYLVGQLYGFPTSIRGLDVLFGGGGVVLAETISGLDVAGARGRIILVHGKAGIGKTLLSLQLALEVAKKGGAAWVAPLEQSPLDCLFALEATFHSDLRGVDVLVGAAEAARLPQVRDAGKGALCIVPKIRSSTGDFLASLRETALSLSGFPLRLVIADPVNSVARGTSDAVALRQSFREALESVVETECNALIVAEENVGEAAADFDFLEKICDTSIHLERRSDVLHSPRFLEIRKSRLQREQRGQHPYSIVPGEGYTIFPSTSAVSARIRNRRATQRDEYNRFGVPGIDRLLGKSALRSGDVVVISGPHGCWRRALALAFTLTSEGPACGARSRMPTVSLLAAFGRSQDALRGMLAEDHISDLARGKGKKAPESVRVLGFGPGYVPPGAVFQAIEQKIEDIRLARLGLDRVFVDGMSALGGTFPLVAADGAFPGTLIEFLRRQRVTSIFVTREQTEDGTVTAGSILRASADLLIDVWRSDAESRHVRGAIRRAHGGRYERMPFNLALVPGEGFDIDVIE